MRSIVFLAVATAGCKQGGSESTGGDSGLQMIPSEPINGEQFPLDEFTFAGESTATYLDLDGNGTLDTAWFIEIFGTPDGEVFAVVNDRPEDYTLVGVRGQVNLFDWSEPPSGEYDLAGEGFEVTFEVQRDGEPVVDAYGDLDEGYDWILESPSFVEGLIDLTLAGRLEHSRLPDGTTEAIDVAIEFALDAVPFTLLENSY